MNNKKSDKNGFLLFLSEIFCWIFCITFHCDYH